MKSQRVFYSEAARRLAERDEAFLELLPTLTRGDLEKLIQRAPERWSRYAKWLDKLPTERSS